MVRQDRSQKCSFDCGVAFRGLIQRDHLTQSHYPESQNNNHRRSENVESPNKNESHRADEDGEGASADDPWSGSRGSYVCSSWPCRPS